MKCYEIVFFLNELLYRVDVNRSFPLCKQNNVELYRILKIFNKFSLQKYFYYSATECISVIMKCCETLFLIFFPKSTLQNSVEFFPEKVRPNRMTVTSLRKQNRSSTKVITRQIHGSTEPDKIFFVDPKSDSIPRTTTARKERTLSFLLFS